MADPTSGAPAAPKFVGRRDELATLAATLRQVRAGSARVAVVSGEAGIGKTRLCHALLESATGFQVLVAAGEHTETGLPYGMLDQLLRGLAQPPAHPGAPPLQVGARLLHVFTDAHARRPLLIWVDDLQWADPPSWQALRFALRRLHADPVAALLCVRDTGGADDAIPGLDRLAEPPRGTRLALGGLGAEDVADLAAVLGTQLPPRTARRVYQLTGGHPLWTVALLRDVPAPRLLDDNADLPAPRPYARIVADRMGRLAAPARALVEACAVAGGETALGTLAVAAKVADPFTALDEALAAGLLAADGTPPLVRAGHALVTSAAYGALGAARRRDLHQAFAELAGNPYERLRHEVAASPGHDADLAGRLETLGRQQAAAGAWEAAAGALRTAARVGGDGVDRRGLLTEAAAAALLGGDPRRARPVCAELAALPATRRTDSLLGWQAMSEGRLEDAERHLKRALAGSAEAEDPAAAAEAGRLLAQLLVMLGRADEAVRPGWRAVALSEPGTPERAAAAGILAMARAVAGDARGVRRDLADLDRVPPGPQDVPVLTSRGLARMWDGDLPGAVADFTTVSTLSAAAGDFAFACSAHALLGTAFHRLGDWDAALAHGERAASLVEDADLGWARPAVHAQRVPTFARRGLAAEASRRAQLAAEAAALTGDTMNAGYAGTAAVVVAHSRGDFAGVLDAAAPMLALTHRVGVDVPGILEWRPLYCEALVRLGRLGDAERSLAAFEQDAAATGRRWPMAAGARVRAALETARGRHREALEALSRAARHAEVARVPFEAALVELQLGESLLGRGRRGEAVTPLRSAQEKFALLGAAPFAALAGQALRACGVSRRPPAPPPGSGALTAQELAVAGLVRAGLSNRSIAAELVISPKTVEFHLRNAYLKLGVASRTQMVARLWP